MDTPLARAILRPQVVLSITKALGAFGFSAAWTLEAAACT